MSKPYTGRDYLLVRLINGATKSYVKTDQKKTKSRTACRKKVRLQNPMSYEV
jgi:hypothetical protein